MAKMIEVFKAGSFIGYRDDNGIIQTDIVNKVISMGEITTVSLGTEVLLGFKNGVTLCFNSSSNTQEDRLNHTNRIYTMFLEQLKYEYPDIYKAFTEELREIEKELKKRIKKNPTVKRLNKYARRKLAALGVFATISMGAAVGYAVTHKSADTDVKSPNTNKAYAQEEISDKTEILATEEIEEFSIRNDEPTTAFIQPKTEAFNTNLDSNTFEFTFNYNVETLEYRELTKHPEYENYLKYYSDEFHVDYNLMRGIALQENGDGYNGAAYGIMQVENIWVGNEISAYSFKKGEVVTYRVYDSNMYVPEQQNYINDAGRYVECRDINIPENNIMFGCMVFQQCLSYTNDNLLAALQCYNYGPGNIDTVLSNYSWASGLSRDEILNDKSSVGWMDYLNCVSAGDSKYISNVMKWLGDNNTFVTFADDGSILDTYNVSSRQRRK